MFFRCNDLRTYYANTRVGLSIGEGVRFLAGQIGNNETLPGQEVPNGNIFPITTGNRTQLPACADPLGSTPFDVECTGLGAWTVRSTYTAIYNNSGYGIRYHRFGNEWVGNVVGNVDKSISLSAENPSRKIIAKTAANGNIQNLPSNIVDVEVCELFDNEVVFPSTLPAITTTEPQTQISLVRKLYQPIPNPARSEVSFSYLLPTAEDGQLIVTDVLGKAEWEKVAVKGSGTRNSISLNIQGLPQGVYYAKLSTKTCWSAIQKLIVIK